MIEGLRSRPIDPLAVSALGLVLLMITPAVAVATAIPAFWWAGDRRYVAAVVLAMLVLNATLAGSVH